MPHAFEELASEELDALYQGALFLAGGNTRDAERLLVDSVTLAFREHARETDIASVERWLEARLVRSFLKQLTDGPTLLPEETARRVALEPGALDAIGSQQLFEAAAALPAWPRAAVWLVLLRRWSYQDAASAMGVDRDDVPGLLRYRDLLVRELIASKLNRPRRLEMGS